MVVDCLGALLRLDPRASTANPPAEWLDVQRWKIDQWAPRKGLRRFRCRVCALYTLPRCVRYRSFPSLACAGHRHLDPVGLKRWAALLKKECDYHMTTYLAVMSAFPNSGDASPSLGETPSCIDDIRIVAGCLHDVLGLYEDIDLPRATETPEYALKKVESGCHACILSVVGGRAQILEALRTSILARELAGGGTSTFLPLVNAWIKCCKEGSLLCRTSDGRASGLSREWRLFGTQHVAQSGHVALQNDELATGAANHNLASHFENELQRRLRRRRS